MENFRDAYDNEKVQRICDVYNRIALNSKQKINYYGDCYVSGMVIDGKPMIAKSYPNVQKVSLMTIDCFFIMNEYDNVQYLFKTNSLSCRW